MNRYLLIAMLMVLSSELAMGQVQKHQFEVLHGDKVIGRMVATKKEEGHGYTINLDFNATLDLILKTVMVEGREMSYFENGTLRQSSVLRKINGKIKSNKQTRLGDSAYVAYDGKVSRAIPLRDIRSNLMSILFFEPADRQRIFSDNLQENLSISQKADHTYHIPMPDGNFNRYVYRNGSCILVELNSSWAKLILKRVL